MAQRLKHLPAMRETWVRFQGREDPLEKEMATHSSILAWRIPWTEEPDGLQSTGSQRIGHDWATSLSLSVTDRTRFKTQSTKLWIHALNYMFLQIQSHFGSTPHPYDKPYSGLSTLLDYCHPATQLSKDFLSTYSGSSSVMHWGQESNIQLTQQNPKRN